MTETESDDGRAAAKQWTVDIGQRVQAERKRQELTAQDLADKTAQLGYAISRATVTAIENGRKELFSVQELTVLARALQIAPVALMYPVNSNGDVRVPGDPPVDVPAIHAARWFTGEHEFGAEVTNDAALGYAWGDYDESTGTPEGYTFPMNDPGPLADLRFLDRHAMTGWELCRVIENVQDRFQATHTAAIRDALSAELAILFEHLGTVLKFSERINGKLAKINAESQLILGLESRYKKLVARQQELKGHWSGGDGHG